MEDALPIDFNVWWLLSAATPIYSRMPHDAPHPSTTFPLFYLPLLVPSPYLPSITHEFPLYMAVDRLQSQF